MNQWAPQDPQLLARVRTFILTGYTGGDRVAQLLSAEKWPTPHEVRYNVKKPRCFWSYHTANRLIKKVSFEHAVTPWRAVPAGNGEYPLPRPEAYALPALRRVILFFIRRGLQPGEEHLEPWLAALRAQLATFPNTTALADRAVGAQGVHLFS